MHKQLCLPTRLGFWAERAVLSHQETSSWGQRHRNASLAHLAPCGCTWCFPKEEGGETGWMPACCWAREAVQVGCPCCPGPLGLRAAGPAAGEPSAAHGSSCCQHFPAVSEGKGDEGKPPAPPSWPGGVPASPLLLGEALGAAREKQTSEQGCGCVGGSPPLSQAAWLPSQPGQVMTEGTSLPSPGNGWVPSQVGVPGHAPLSGPLLHQKTPMLKPGLTPTDHIIVLNVASVFTLNIYPMF